MGRKSHQKALELGPWYWADFDVIVFSHTCYKAATPRTRVEARTMDSGWAELVYP